MQVARLGTLPIDLPHVFIYQIRDPLMSHEDWAALLQAGRSGFTMLGKFRQVANGKNAHETSNGYKDEH